MTSVTFEQLVDLETRKKMEIIERAAMFANKEQSRLMKAYKKMKGKK